MRALRSVASVASNPATHPTGPWRAPGAAASACGATYGVRGSLTPVAGTAATGSFSWQEPAEYQPSRAGGPLTRVQSSTPGTSGAEEVDVVRVRPLLGENHTHSCSP